MYKTGKSMQRKTAMCTVLAAVYCTAFVAGAGGYTALADESQTADGVYYNKIAQFDTGNTNEDGGTAEIVHYNSDNNKMYLVNGADKSIDIIALESYGSGGAQTVFNENTDRIYIDDIVTQNSSCFAEGFAVGEISSVAVNTGLDVVAVAVQHSDYTRNGAVVLLDYDGAFIAAYQTGVQPDNVVFSGSYILTADEGEPREGYGEGTTDPKGSVTIVSGISDANLTGGTSTQVYFDKYDNERETLVEKNVLLMSGANPSTDFEPEYIATNGNGYAYVSLQEANAIAILDIANASFTAVCSLGFKDHSQSGNGLDLINDKTINIKTESVYGVYMPDGMDIYTADDGSVYLITANEGDAREWGDFSGVTTKAFTDDSGANSTNVEILDNTKWDGLPDNNATYVLGGRSFSVFKVTGSSVTMVYDSGDGIEQAIAASGYSDYFNCNSTNTTLDARSKKKGPEPEDVTVYKLGESVYVSVCLERQSGFVTFDISGIVAGQSTSATTIGYTTSRDFTSDMAGDVAPENLEYVAAADNALSKDLIIMANENSGTVSVYAIESTQQTYTMNTDYTEAEKESTAASALITTVFATGDNVDGAYNYSFVTIANNTYEELDMSGWTIQYKTGDTEEWASYTLKTVLNARGTYTVACAGAYTETSGDYSNRVTLTADNYDAVWTELAYFDNKDLSVRIVDADGNVIDALGVYEKAASNYETGEGTLQTGISKQKVVYRNTDADGNYVDTDNNIDDFSISDTSKNSDATAYSSYTPAANGNAQATAKVTVDAQNATLSLTKDYYVIGSDVSFTVAADSGYTVTAVTAGGQTLTAVDGTYTFTLTADATIAVTVSVAEESGDGDDSSSTEDSSTEDSSTEDSSTEDSSTEDSSTEDSSTEDSSTEDSSAAGGTTDSGTTGSGTSGGGAESGTAASTAASQGNTSKGSGCNMAASESNGNIYLFAAAIALCVGALTVIKLRRRSCK